MPAQINNKTFTVISDMHGQFKKLSIRKSDFLIICGDIFNRNDKIEVNIFMNWLKELDVKHILIVYGNHEKRVKREMREKLSKLTNVHILENELCVIEDIQFYGFSFHIGEEELEKAKNAIDINKKCVAIAHKPPYLIRDYKLKDLKDSKKCSKIKNFNKKKQMYKHSGSYELKDFCKKFNPQLCCFGHCHISSGYKKIEKTLYINASVVDEFKKVVNKPVELIFNGVNFIRKSWNEEEYKNNDSYIDNKNNNSNNDNTTESEDYNSDGTEINSSDDSNSVCISDSDDEGNYSDDEEKEEDDNEEDEDELKEKNKKEEDEPEENNNNKQKSYNYNLGAAPFNKRTHYIYNTAAKKYVRRELKVNDDVLPSVRG